MKTLPRSSSTKRLQNAFAIAIVCSMLLVLQGCGIPKLHGPQPAPGVPPTFNGLTSPYNTSQLSPFEFFNDPQLSGLVDQALFSNQQLRILAQDIQVANNEIWKRSGAYLPFVTFGAGASLDKLSTYTPPGADLSQIVTPSGGPFPNPLPDYLFSGNLTWQVDIWRQLRNARDVAGLHYLGTIDGRNYVMTRLVAEIADNYYQLMGLDNQLQTLDRTIAVQEQSLEVAKFQKEGVRGNELGVQRFTAEVRMNQSQKLIIRQQIIETENRINFLVGRYPQPVERNSAAFLELQLRTLSVGVPSDLLANRPDIRQAERELAAAGLDIRVARANFFPKLILTSGVGYEAFQPRYLFFTPESLIYSVAGGLVAPLVNRRAIQADFMTANAKQLQALYEYQRTVLNAFTEVINRLNKVQNYTQSIEIKKQQLVALEAAVNISMQLFQNARIEYIDVLFAQRDRNNARIVLIETKQEQLAAVVDAYQALGGGWRFVGGPMQMLPIGPPGEDVQPPAEALPAPQPGAANQGPQPPGLPNQGPPQPPGPVIQGPAQNGPVNPGPPQPPGPMNQGPGQPPGPAIQGPAQPPVPGNQGLPPQPGPAMQGPPPSANDNKRLPFRRPQVT